MVIRPAVNLNSRCISRTYVISKGSLSTYLYTAVRREKSFLCEKEFPTRPFSSKFPFVTTLSFISR